jgi:hypothetical protein
VFIGLSNGRFRSRIITDGHGIYIPGALAGSNLARHKTPPVTSRLARGENALSFVMTREKRTDVMTFGCILD